MDVVQNFLNQLALTLHLPPELLSILYPLIWVLNALSNIHIDLSAVQVTCTGSQAPFEIIINCIILGLVEGVIQIKLPELLSVSVNKTTNDVLLLLCNDYFKKRKVLSSKWGFSKDIWIGFKLSVIMQVISLNPLLKVVQFSISLVRLEAFFPFHASDASCNQVPGFIGIDNGLSVVGTVFTYSLIVPVIYTLFFKLVPGIPYKSWISTEGSIMKKVDKWIKVTNKTHCSFEVPSPSGGIYKMIYDFVAGICKVINILLRSVSPGTLLYLVANPALSSTSASLDSLTSEEVAIKRGCYESLCDWLKSLCGLFSQQRLSELYKRLHSKPPSDDDSSVPSFYTLSMWVHSELNESYNTSQSVWFDKFLLIWSFTIPLHMITMVGCCFWLVTLIKVVRSMHASIYIYIYLLTLIINIVCLSLYFPWILG